VISEALTIAQKTVDVLGSRMTYLELGEGEPVLFVHGNPTSSYLWRNVMPHAGEGHRAIAIDLIGMGGSGKPDIAYSFDDHYRYFAAFIDALRLDTVTLVGHDWGAALAWEYARRNPTRVRRLAFMEGVLPPAFPAPSFEAMGPDMEKMFRAFKDPVLGPRVVIDEHMFVEQILPGFVNRTLGDEAMRAYRAPFLAREERRPVLAWPRQVPIAGEPASTTTTLNGISAFMATTKMPVLLVYAEPGAVVPPSAVAWYVKRIANLETSFVGQGFHFIQEDQPDAVGRAIADWIRRH
jgi:haloalkane dehalogenase